MGTAVKVHDDQLMFIIKDNIISFTTYKDYIVDGIVDDFIIV